MREPPVLDSPEAIEAHLVDALDLWERGEPGVRFVLCDGADRVRLHCPVDGLAPGSDLAECARAVSVFATALAEGEDDGSLLVVLTRPGVDMVTDSDRVWFHAAHEACAKIGVRLLGVHLATPTGLRPIVLDDAL